MTDYDIVVVGAGPAGATFARIADPALRILLLDGSQRAKPCGGLLAPDAQKALARFDLTLPKDILVDPQIFSVRTIDLNTRRQRSYQRMYLNVDREKFDRWLVAILPERVKVVRGACRRIIREKDGFTVTYTSPDGPVSVRAARVVGADGANSLVRRSLLPALNTRRYVALQQWFAQEPDSSHPFYSCIFDRETTDCCSWSIHKDGFLIFGGAFPPRDCRRNFEAQKRKLTDFGFQLDRPVRTEACLVLRPRSPRSFCCGAEGVFLIGEAAGFISPSSLEGISTAIESAVCLAQCLQPGGQGGQRLYRRRTRRLRLKLLAKNLKCPLMYQPALRRLVMASGLTSISIYRS